VTGLPHVQRFRDRHGKLRCYVRNTITQRRIAITAEDGTAEFMAAYHNALAALGLSSRASPERALIMHRNGGNEWEQWRVYPGGGRWRRELRTK
jgi:hypothetical protein